jgi:hypothetical protein
MAGIAAGAIYLIGPARLLRIVGMSISVLQSARTLRAAQRMFMNQ